MKLPGSSTPGVMVATPTDTVTSRGSPSNWKRQVSTIPRTFSA
jgi:hypothetical protein